MNNDVVVTTGTDQGIGLECAEYFWNMDMLFME